ncbi:MAG: aminotransferase class I/II-fold pyridoxal phosphate-dependent enzyme, partial [Pseudomonadota bacterium]
MKPSARIAGINADGSDGWGVMYQARDLKRAGLPVLDLTIGDHDWATPAPLIDAMAQSARDGDTGYAPIAGLPPLRHAIAERVARQTGVPTSPENVMVVPGGQGGLFSS